MTTNVTSPMTGPMTGPKTPVLVTGGAGYIGSHTCKALARAGFVPIVFDDLSNGHEALVRWGPLEEGDLRDRARLEAVFAKHRPAAILHFAGLIEVGASVADPVSFMDVNAGGSANLFAVADAFDCRALVFSSTCATYGEPRFLPLTEDHPQEPINPYGRSKLMVEQMLDALDEAGTLRSVRLRYFNAAGADADLETGEWHDPETHVIPLLIEAANGRRAGFKIFGDDYDTPDGTCVRDFVHVEDLADAHVSAVRHLLDGGRTAAFNLGSGVGSSVRELCAMVGEIEGRPVPVTVTERRAGDPPSLVADPSRAREVLGWSARHDLRSIVTSASRWHAARAGGAAR